MPIEIKLLNESEAKERANYHDLWRFERNFFFHKDFQKKKNEISKIRPELPELDVTCIPLFIQTVSFYLFYTTCATHYLKFCHVHF